MARTVNPTLYTVRRDAFLDVAQRLIQTKADTVTRQNLRKATATQHLAVDQYAVAV